jgi:hypothetical protein
VARWIGAGNDMQDNFGYCQLGCTLRPCQTLVL